MNTPMKHLFSASTHVEERPAPPVHEPGTLPPEQEGRRLHLTRLAVVVVVVALIAAFGAIVLTQPAPVAPAFGTVSTVLGPEANWALQDAVAAPDGSLYIAARGATNAINKVAPNGQLTTLRVPGTDLGPVDLRVRPERVPDQHRRQPDPRREREAGPGRQVHPADQGRDVDGYGPAPVPPGDCGGRPLFRRAG
jgi:hypothetical protein